MPSDDLVLNVRQLAGYPPVGSASPAAALLMQVGLGGPYVSISPQALVGTALQTGGDMAIAGAVAVQSVSGGSAQFSNGMFGMFSAQKACIVDLAATWGTIAGVAIATVNDVSALDAALRASTVWTFNGRRGDVRLWIDDIICAGGAPIFSPRFQGSPRACTPPPESNSSRIATTAFVHGAIGGAELVVSFNGRVGAVVLEAADVTALDLPYAPIDNPNFTGYATALTPPQGTSTGQIATTAFVMNAVAASVTGVASFNGRTGLVVLSGADLTGAGGALLVSPAFTGVPTATTPAPGTDTTQLATTAFVMAATGGGNFAPLNSPAFIGTPTGPTATPGTDTAQLATTAFVIGEIQAVNAGVISFNGRSGVITLLANDISAAGGATLASPIFTGLPSAPTANPGTNTTQLATTQFVTAAIAALPAVPIASTTNPLMNGTATPGVATAWSRGDHRHPTDTSRAAQSSLANYLPLAGGTLTGTLAGGSGVFDDFQTDFVTIPSGGIALNQYAAPSLQQIQWSNVAPVACASIYFSYTTPAFFIANQLQPSSLTFDAAQNMTFGGANCLKPGGGEWLAASDARVKTVEGDYGQGLDEILQLRPVVYRYKGNDTLASELTDPQLYPAIKEARAGQTPYPASRHYHQAKHAIPFVGLVAQEAEAIFPGMVTKGKGFIDGVPVDDLRLMDRSSLVFALVNAVKTLAARLTALEQAA